MKSILALLLVAATASTLLLSTSCRKGRNLPENVPVYIDTTGIYATVDEVYHSTYDVNRKYITEELRESIVDAFYQDLRYFLKKNNCISVQNGQMYTVKVKSISLRESITRKTYVDSCLTGCTGPTYYGFVYPSRVSYSSHLEVFTREGLSLGDFVSGVDKREKTSGCDSCNKPYVKCIRLSPSKMRTRVTKQQRKNITKVIYKHWRQNHLD